MKPFRSVFFRTPGAITPTGAIPPSGGGESDSDVEVLEDGSDVEVWDAPGAADTGGEEGKEP